MSESTIARTFTFTAPDGVRIFVRKWLSSSGGPLLGVVQIAHGAAEHSLRYDRFARFLNQAGYAVYANDDRGHYMTAGSRDKAGIAGPDGWNRIVGDAKQLTDLIRSENAGIPVFLIGHSMGSLVAQQYTEHWGADLKGVVLSGTFGAIAELDAAIAALELLASGKTATEPCALFAASFASFNEPFKPAKTGFEWLSRDEAEVQKYAADPWCGFPFSNALVLDMFKSARETWKPENEGRIPKHLPIFMVSGDLDPVGGNTVSVKLLIDRYRAGALTAVKYKFYPGARHELLNETNRAEVQQDILDWLESVRTARGT